MIKEMPIVTMWFFGFLLLKSNMGDNSRDLTKEELRETMDIDRSIYMTGESKITLREIKRREGKI